MKSFKRIIASFATLALLLTNASIVFAQTFDDVPTDAWYFDYVEQLVDEGVFQVDTNFRPGDALNRAELTKIAIVAIDGLAGYDAPATPTFDDVPADQWYFDYVEAAVQLGIVTGYTDVSGNLTGLFGPSDTVNRAAATKILVNAFAVPTTLSPSSPFADVPASAWFHDYVLTAYNQSVLDGYDDGSFGPADAVTRAQIAKLVVNSQDPVFRVEPTGDEVCGDGVVEGAEQCDDGNTTSGDGCNSLCKDEVGPTGEGDLEVSLNDDSAPSTTIPQYASNVQLVTFDFTAADDDVLVSNVVVTRGGVGQSDDWDALYVYDGAFRLTTGRTVNSDTNTATFALNLVVEAGTTRTLTLVGDLINTAFAGTSNQHYFYVASAADITSNAVSVAGDFPVRGNTFTISGESTIVNSLQINPGTAPSQPTIGQADAEIASIRLVAGSVNDVAVHQLTLTQGGSLSSNKLVNCRLLRSTDEVATAAGFDGDRVTFVLDTPFKIPEGQTKTFYVRCDVDGGRSTDSIRLYLDENTDLVAIDQQFGYGAVIDNQFRNGTTIGLKGGAAVITDNGPIATQLAQNSTNNELLNFTVATERDLTVRDTYISITLQSASGANPMPTIAGVGFANLITAGAGTSSFGASTITAGDLSITSKVGDLDGYIVDLVANNTLNATATVTGSVAGISVTVEYDGDSDPSFWNDIVVAIQGDVIANADISVSTTNATDIVVTADDESIVLGGFVAGAGSDTSSFCFTPVIGTAVDPGDMLQIVAASGSTVYGVVETVAPLSPGCTVGTDTAVTTNLTVGDPVAFTATDLVTEVDPYSYIRNVRLIDLDTGTTLAGPMTNATSGAALQIGDFYDKVHTEDYELIGADARHFSLQADIDQSMAPGYQLRAAVRFSANNAIGTDASFLKDLDANEFVTVEDIVGAGITALAGKWMTTATNSLALARAVTPASSDYVKGQTHVPSLGFTMTAGDAGDITVKRLTVRAYADNGLPQIALVNDPFGIGGTPRANGNLAANTLVSSITLYDGDTVVAGPEGLSLIDVGSLTGTYQAGDYYKAQFDDLNIVIAKGQSKTLVAKINLFNTTTLTVHIALDMDPGAGDVVAEDADANTITATGNPLNDGLDSTLLIAEAHLPLMTVIPSGSLTAAAEGKNTKIILAGSTEQLLVRYRFNAVDEGFYVKKLNILQDDGTTDAADCASALPCFDDDETETTDAVTQITIKYPDVDGNMRTATGTLNAGSGLANFSGLDFYVPPSQATYLEVYANVSTIGLPDNVGEFLSGRVFRLGIQGEGNTTSTFEAVGEASSETTNFELGTEISGETSIKSFVVRKTIPTFEKIAGLGSSLSTGVNTLYGLKISADSAGPVTFGRFTFILDSDQDLTLFQLLDEDDNIISGAEGVLDVNIMSGAQDLGGVGTLTSGTGQTVFVSFNNEESITAGGVQTYELKATSAAVVDGNSVQTRLSTDDDNDPILLMDGIGCDVDDFPGVNENTALLIDTDGTCGLFSNELNFHQNDGATYVTHIAWSDNSNKNDAAIDFTVSGSGSYDWTNGYLLKANKAISHTLTKG